MASTYSTSLKIQLMGNGEDSGTWGSITNTNWNLMEQAVSGVQTIVMANTNYTLSNLNGTSDEARNMVIVATGTNSSICQIVAPLAPKFYVVTNNTTGGYAVTFGGSSGSIITVPNATTVQVYCDGTNFYSAQTSSAGNFNVNGNETVSGNLTVSGTFNYIPSGVIQMWPTATAPAGFLLCNGASVSTTTYANLFAAIGYTFGGSGASFLLPDYRNRMPIGAGTIAGIAIPGGSANAVVVTHTHTASSGNQSANHSHSGTTDGMNASNPHSHGTGNRLAPNTGGGPGFGGGSLYAPTDVQSGTDLADINHGHTFTTGGVSADHNHVITVVDAGVSGVNANLPPYLGIAFIIKT